MSLYNPVVWQDGMFMKPQHFQQFDRAQTKLSTMLFASSTPLHWGVNQIEINTELLTQGKIAVTRAIGVLQDKTPFDLPLLAEVPDVKEVDPSITDKVIYLCCPLPSEREELFGSDKDGARYLVHHQDAVDAVYASEDTANIAVGQLKFRLMTEDEDRSAYTAIPILKIAEVKPDGTVVLDERYIPTCIDINASKVLSKFTKEFASMLKHRAESIVERLGTVDQQGVSTVSDFMLLQALNRYEPLFWHFSSVEGVHPESLYRILLQAEGELSTLCSTSRRPPQFIEYNHGDLTSCLSHTLENAKRTLSVMSEQRAIPLTLKEQNFGIRTAVIPDKKVVETATFILAVKADVTLDVLHTQFVTQTKIGSIDNIRDLINLQLPGIGIKPMPVVPRALPYHAGYTYFELDRASEEWAGLESASAIAVHVSGEFANLSLQLWAVRA
ncbi:MULTISPECIES: type VI secretion system baseplate subunit TssK [Vibrio]|uniref:Type VI secretion system baseplate subunit TssK n=3 Tax=Vibrio TaxID=662 RepID=A0ABS2ZXJ7_9VIBR|nr:MULTISPECIES: type VI secretion system baseplate subunit TssK [Vibrio]MBN3492361.1 type VI secretion system baseplate subunit TssK [Vibrio neptunius]MBN3514824.1 type VI secretion system baseplate subunit TssK [Vibrio neptunius]MBN3549741.1 type VI secretion system baseplate subunit TssK [Vibrio neptunius]MBN3576986.1 type VI secretion system baseplate subunit TssK [Vibrio neptunius]MCH9870650.1 type VI secretion system baseplate subunit TssK [Vibrio neptunius]